MKIYLTLISLSALLCGCTTWEKPAATHEQKLQAKYSCKKDVHQTWYWGDRIWGFTPIGLIETGAESGELYSQCMKSKGWSHKSISKATQENQENNSILLRAQQEYKKCISDLGYNLRDQNILRHMPSNIDGKFTFYQTSDTTVPTLLESNILAGYFSGSTLCRAKYIATINSLLTSTQKQVYAQRDIEHNAASSELARRKISYGEWAQRENESIDKAKLKLQQ